ncbi:MAG: type VI secretion system contractile sheath large subunit [Planctomycetes bacterium]|nr:type VI secretion system contractile sheath large subunit [Planctomycetota bacterium]
MTDPNAAPRQQGAQQELTTDDFRSLLGQSFGNLTEAEKDTATKATEDFISAVVEDANLVGANVFESLRRARAKIDEVLSAQVNEILHHPDFQKLESAWLGLHDFVNGTETSTQLKIRVMNVTKDEIARELQKFKGAMFDQSPLFKKLYTAEYDQLGGAPYGLVVTDYHFDHTARDIMIMGEMAKIGSACHAPVLAGAAPSLFRLGSWEDVMNPQDLAKIQDTPEFAAWRALRESEDSRFLGLCAPRYMVRAPFDPESNPVEGFGFKEDVGGGDGKRFAWANAAYARALNITRAFKDFGWCTRIIGVESGGKKAELPVVTFENAHGGVDQKCPTEIAISERREKELSDLGVMALVHRKSSNEAVFFSAQSVHKPEQYDDPAATASSELSAGINYLMASCRFAHYLKSMVRDKIGGFKERGELESWLKRWISQYVCANPESVSEETKAQQPLKKATLVVEPIPGKPGEYHATFKLTPHYQLKAMDVTLSLVGDLSAKAG